MINFFRKSRKFSSGHSLKFLMKNICTEHFLSLNGFTSSMLALERLGLISKFQYRHVSMHRSCIESMKRFPTFRYFILLYCSSTGSYFIKNEGYLDILLRSWQLKLFWSDACNRFIVKWLIIRPVVLVSVRVQIKVILVVNYSHYQMFSVHIHCNVIMLHRSYKRLDRASVILKWSHWRPY